MLFTRQMLLEYKFSSAFISFFVLLKGLFFRLNNKNYHAFNEFCCLVRSTSVKFFYRIGIHFVDDYIKKSIKIRKNLISEYIIKTSYPNNFKNKYSISGIGQQDIFRDIIVLKSPLKNEKGVILLKYAKTFDAFLYFFDAEKLMEKYYFVLEPCWAGYCNPNILSWIIPKHKNNVIVQCYTQSDFDFIKRFSPYLTPIRLGPADWVNVDLFKPINNINKDYDIIMIANWSKIKRHKILFKALSQIDNRSIKVLLIGYPWGGRTSDDIISESKMINRTNIEISIKENIPHHEVVRNLNRSKVMLFLTWKEGDNKAIVEALFSGVPTIVYSKTIGGAQLRVNSQTGIFSDYSDLPNNILYMLDNFNKFSPREWALNNTGSNNSTKLLNEQVRRLSSVNGENFTEAIVEKINSPNLSYKFVNRRQFSEDYSYLNATKKPH